MMLPSYLILKPRHPQAIESVTARSSSQPECLWSKAVDQYQCHCYVNYAEEAQYRGEEVCRDVLEHHSVADYIGEELGYAKHGALLFRIYVVGLEQIIEHQIVD